MMPLEESVNNSLYYKTEDGDFKELSPISKINEGVSLFAEGVYDLFKNITENIVDLGQKLANFTASVDIKSISRKRFKKLLMAKLIQRNEAEKICRKELKQKGFYSVLDLLKY